MNRETIVAAIANVKQAFSDEPLTYKLDRQEIDDLLAAIVGIAAEGWQPIETVPDMRVVLLCHEYYSHGRVRQGYYGRMGWMGVNANGSEGKLNFEPTHWQHLPAAAASDSPPMEASARDRYRSPDREALDEIGRKPA